jgi:hypothetical protein
MYPGSGITALVPSDHGSGRKETGSDLRSMQHPHLHSPEDPSSGSSGRSIPDTNMASKITATDQKRLAALFGDLTAERAKLEDCVRVFNEAIAAARAALQTDVDAFNEKVQGCAWPCRRRAS